MTPSSDSRGVQKRRVSTECSRKPCPLSSQKRHLGTPEDEDLNEDPCETWELFPCSKLPTHLSFPLPGGTPRLEKTP